MIGWIFSLMKSKVACVANKLIPNGAVTQLIQVISYTGTDPPAYNRQLQIQFVYITS